MAKKGWPQGLDNGVMNKPDVPGPQSRQSTQARIGKNMDFYSAIASGENDKGQITVAPGQLVRGGEVIREQEGYSRSFHGGDRWNRPVK